MQQFTITEPAPGYLRATFDNPPINLLDDTTVDELVEVLAEATSAHARVLVFDSINPDFFLARYDVSQPRPGGSPFGDLERFLVSTDAMARSGVISIAQIRGRTRGGGSELALACDFRFASIENALLGQPELPSGLLPAGGGIERLTELVGRARALEIIASGDDYDAKTAETYGWVNRALPDAELDAFVDTFARRLASFDGDALTTAKRLVNRSLRTTIDDVRETLAAIGPIAAASAPRRVALREQAIALGADFELDLGRNLGPGA
ncbi:enoyl-CoA hydratase/isomerase family protein [Plantibacter sp. Mn2098]|uniref:enoyl-CoA hydratase/isomerase family protein n=1 Tax=Plantibacter sp. Mn2098 TaxID=3395266 RepID=UPI003BCE7436